MLAICHADRKSININMCQMSQFIVTKCLLVCWNQPFSFWIYSEKLIFFNISFLSRLLVAVSLSVGLPRGCIATPCTRHFCGYGCKGCGCVEAGGPLITSQSKSAVRREPGVEWGEARSEGVVVVRWMECPSSLRPILQHCVGLSLGAGRPVRFGLWQLCDVKHCTDAQVKLSQNSP